MEVDELGADTIKDYEALVQKIIISNEPIGENSIKQIDKLIKDSENDEDPIYQVNCLQLLADLASSNRALALLEDRQVPKKLINFLEQSDPLIVPHALKFFYRVNPVILETKYPEVLDKLCDYCQSENKQLLDYAIDLIAVIGRAGLLARKVLDRHPKFKDTCLGQLGYAIVSSADSIIKSRTLRCIKDLIELQEGDNKEETSGLSEKFYHAIIKGDHRMTNQLLALCRVPFIEIRVNAMLVVAAIANQIWGQKELASHSNFLKWIIDRSSEACKEGKEAKFEILIALVKSGTASKVFKGEDYLKLRADFKNGPFHVGVAEEMMMDNQQAG